MSDLVINLAIRGDPASARAAAMIGGGRAQALTGELSMLPHPAVMPPVGQPVGKCSGRLAPIWT